MADQHTRQERIAIVGIGLTLPGGVTDPDSFWKLLENKVDATCDIPADRWDVRRFYSPFGSEKPGKMYVKRGGFLQGEVGAFDPLYFGMSPREASVVDFQQRLLLEVSARALQDAGITEAQCARSNTGVFIGGFCMDAKIEASHLFNRPWGITQSVTGNTATLLSNRISYAFDLKGPSLTVDTACSSSLVAAHLAVEALRAGECDTALVGGVNVMTQPEHFLEMCKGRLLGKDGRCYTWDQRANGYARGEGAAVLVLKRLSQAQADGDHIYAVIEATGVNQDGTTKGISLPNPEAQKALIEKVIAKAGLTPSDIDYVEAHGTGTQAGDKAETSALNHVFQPGRHDKLVIGSVKTNIGHLEAAAGVSGLVKAALSLKHGKVVPNLHFETPNPEIPFDRMCLQVPTEVQPWPRSGKVRYAGVNSFGYGGTNAHVILSEPPRAAQQAAAAAHDELPSALVLPLSARSKESLKALAQQYADVLQSGAPVMPFLRRVALKRDHFDRRALVHAASVDQLVERLQAFGRGQPSEGVATVESANGESPLVFVYSGMGPQWWGMGQELMAREPLFRRKVEEYDAAFQKVSGWSILKEMLAGEEASNMARTQVAQPANFVLQAALTDLWASWGIKPAVVVGHSVGEVTSSYVSGILSLEDAMRVSFHRSRLQGSLAGQGAMLAVGLPEAEARAYLAGLEGQVAIAAVNSPQAVTLAGHAEPLMALAKVFQEKGVFHRALKVEVAYHSPVMDPIEAELKASLQGLQPRAATVPCYSTVSGRLAQAGDFGADYWWANVRQSVLFAKAIDSITDQGHTSFLEVGPHPVVTSSVKEVLAKKRISGQCYTSLNRKPPEQGTLLQTLGQLYAQGHALDWNTLLPGTDRYLPLPAYPWQRAHYSNSTPRFYQDKFGEPGHPILLRNLQLPEPSWEVELLDSLFPYLKDHRIGGRTIVPGAFYVEAALAVRSKLTGERTGGLRNVSFERILPVPEEMDAEERRMVSAATGNQQSFRIYSTTTAREESWSVHAHGDFAPVAPYETGLDVQDHALDSFAAQDVGALYATIAETGLYYGPFFRPIQLLKRQGDLVYAEIENTLAAEADYILSPTVLDSAFQTLFVFAHDFGVPFIPVKIDRLSVHGTVTPRCKVFGRLLWISAHSLKADFMLFDEHDNPVVEISGVTCQALQQMGSADTGAVATYVPTWVPFEAQAFAERAQAEAGVALLDLDAGWQEPLLQQLQDESVDRLVVLLPQAGAIGQAYEQAVAVSARLAELVQLVNQHRAGRTVELLLCTRDAQRVVEADHVDGLALASVWGLGRTINTEYPNIRCSCIDFGAADEQEMTLFQQAVLGRELGVRELAIRGQAIYEHTLVRREAEAAELFTAESQPGQKLVLDGLPSDEAAFRTAEREQPDDKALEIEVEQMMLSRWDAASQRLKVYPDDPARHFFRYQPGMQCVATVLRKGAAVADVAVGDRVAVLHPLGLTNIATVPAAHAVKLPAELGAAPLPDLYELVRAAYALRLIGSLDKGRTLLIKGVWGCFALALAEQARDAGLRVVFVDEQPGATSESQATALPGLHYLPDHEGAWIDQLAATAQRVDVFVNDGGHDIASVAMLNPFGKVIDFRFAQADRRAQAAVPACNAAWHVVDIDALYRDHFGLVKELLAKALADLASGKLVLPGLPEYAMRDIGNAAALLEDGSAASVAVRMKGETVPLEVKARLDDVAPDGTYVITGGTRGFGLRCAQWLARQGAKHLVLMSRSGLAEASAVAAVEALRADGVQVEVCALDIADASQLGAELRRLRGVCPPVKGVIHSAMVLDDDFLARMDESRFRRVMGPKVAGALALHEALAGDDLDFFLMFSSISSLIGNSGQANYVAANAFLDGFAAHLMSRGVNARTINWGVLAEAGVLANDAALTKVLEMAGIHGLSNAQAMGGMERVLQGADAQVGVFIVDWRQWALSNPSLSQSGFYRELQDQAPGEEQQKLLQVLEQIIDLGTDERKAHIEGELKLRFGEIFRMSPDAIDSRASIIELGVDSLIATEISVALKAQLGVDVPLIELLAGPSIETLATKVLAQLEALIDDAASAAPAEPAAPSAAPAAEAAQAELAEAADR